MKNRLFLILLFVAFVFFSCGSKQKTKTSMGIPTIDQTSIANANDSLGDEFKCEFVLWKVDNVTKNNKLETNYNVTGLKINGHKIDITDTLKIPATAVSADTSLILKTKDFGPVLIKLRKGNKEVEFSLKMFMTVEQKSKIEQTTR